MRVETISDDGRSFCIDACDEGAIEPGDGIVGEDSPQKELERETNMFSVGITRVRSACVSPFVPAAWCSWLFELG